VLKLGRWKKQAIMVSVLSLMTVTVNAADMGRIFNLQECINIALKQSPLMRSAEMDSEAAKEVLRSSHGALLPRFDLNAAYMKENQAVPYIPAESLTIPPKFSNDVYSWNAYIRMPVYEGGRLTGLVALAELEKNVQSSRAAFTKQELVANITNTFNKLLQIREMKKANIKSVEALERQWDNTELLVKTGRSANLELLRIDVQLAGEKQNLIKAAEAINRTRNLLALFMGIDAHEISDIAGSIGNEATIKERDTAELIRSRPDIVILSGRVKQAGKRVDIAGAKRYPAVALVGNYGNKAGATIGDRKEVWEAGMVASINLFDGGIASADIRREQALQKRAEEELRLAELKAGTEIENALSSFREAKQRLELSQKALDQSGEALRIEELKYQTGAGTITDVLLAQSAMSFGQANYHQALYDHNAAITEYKRATGTIEVKQ
jgi:outer membrane protein